MSGLWRLAARCAGPGPRTFTMEELIANHLPDVSDYPCFSLLGPNTIPVNTRRLFSNSPTGIDMLTTVQPHAGGMDLAEIKRLHGDRLSSDGTVSIQQDLPNHTADEVRQIVRDRIDVMAPDGGFVLAPTHATQPDTSPENVVAIYEEGFSYGWYVK